LDHQPHAKEANNSHRPKSIKTWKDTGSARRGNALDSFNTLIAIIKKNINIFSDKNNLYH